MRDMLSKPCSGGHKHPRPPEEKKKRKTSTPAMGCAAIDCGAARTREPAIALPTSRRQDKGGPGGQGGLLTNISGENKLIKTAKGQLSPTQKALDAFANAAADIRSLASPRQSPRPPAAQPVVSWDWKLRTDKSRAGPERRTVIFALLARHFRAAERPSGDEARLLLRDGAGC